MEKHDFSYNISNFHELLENHSIQDLLKIKKTCKEDLSEIAKKFFFEETQESSPNLKLKAWFLLPRQTSNLIKFEDIAKQANLFPIKEELKQEALQTLVAKDQRWRLHDLRFWGISSNTTDSQGHNLLHVACYEGNLEFAKELILSEFDLIYQVDKNGNTPLHLAIRAEKPNFELIKLLLKHGSDTSLKNNNGNTPLHIAIMARNSTREIIQLLIEKTPDLCDRNNHGKTPLHLTLLNSNKNFSKFKQAVIQHLLENGAAELDEEKLKLIKIFLNNPSKINQKDTGGKTPFQIALNEDPLDINFIELLMSMGGDVNQPNSEGNPPLHAASLQNPPNLRLIEFFIERGVSMEQHNLKGFTPLEVVIMNTPANLRVIEFLIQKGADVNPFYLIGNPPFYLALSKEPLDLELIEFLIKMGANVNQMFPNGNYPLHTAISQKMPRLIELLIDKGADSNQLNHQRISPLKLTLSQETPDLNLVKFLMDKGARIPDIFNESVNRETVELMIKLGGDINQLGSDGKSLLSKVVSKAPVDINLVQFLVEKGANVNQLNSDGRSPLHGVSSNQPYSLDLVSFLIDSGANINQQDLDGNPPLHLAILQKNFNLELIEFLIKKGADLAIINNAGRTGSLLIRARGIKMVNLQKPQLSHYDREFELKELLSNSWSIKQPKEGGFNHVGQKKNIKLLTTFKDSFSIFDLKKACDEIKDSYDVSKNDPAEIAKKYQLNETILFATGWQGHAIQAVFYKDYLLVCNRGDKRQPSSIKVFKIDRANNPLTEEDIITIQKRPFNSTYGAYFFYETLPARLGFNQSDLIGKFMDENCHQRSQKQGNCWWTSPKTGVLAMFLMQSLKEIDSQPLDENEKLAAFKKAFDAMQIVYKSYSEFARIEILKEYLQKSDNVERDHKLVKAIHDKFLKRNWKYAFGNESPEVKEILENFAGSLEGKEFPKLHSKKEIEDLFKQYRKQYQLNETFEPIAAA